MNPDPIGGEAFVDTVYKYDILDQVVETVEEVRNDGSSPLFLRTLTRYDANGNAVLTIHPEGNAMSARYDERDLLFQETVGTVSAPAAALLAATDPTDYDVRGGAPAVVTYHYNGSRNLVEIVDAADTDGSAANNSDIGGAGERTRHIYDGFDRRTSAVDPAGNQTVTQYDPAGNVVRTLSFGPVGGPTPTADGPDALSMPVSSNGVVQSGNLVEDNLMAASETLYDELGRPFQTDRVLFVNTVPLERPADVAAGAQDAGKGDLTPGDRDPIPGVAGVNILGRVSSGIDYDRNSRPVRLTEDDGDATQIFYDGAGRAIKRVDAEGNTVETAYDDNGNVIEILETDMAQVPGVTDEQFLTTSFYDTLNRRVQQTDNLGQTTYFAYDSRDNLVATADALGPVTGAAISRRAFPAGALTVNDINEPGNVTLSYFDGLSRKTREETVLTASGEGDGNLGVSIDGVKLGNLNPDFAQGGGDGLITVRYEYDDDSLLTHLTDDSGNQTQYSYDNLNRRLTETKGICVPPALADRCDPPTTTSYAYDPDSNLVQLTDENGSVITTSYDALNRPVAEDIARASGVVGTTATTYKYDGLSRLTRATDNNEPNDSGDDSTITRAYDSLGRLLEETQQTGAWPARVVSSAWRAANLRVGLTYPNGRVLAYTFDGLDRITAIGARSYLQYLPVIFQAGATQAAPVAGRLFSPASVAEPPLATYSYTGRGRMLERAYANGTRMTFLDDTGATDSGYDGLRRPVELRHLRADNSLVVGFATPTIGPTTSRSKRSCTIRPTANCTPTTPPTASLTSSAGSSTAPATPSSPPRATTCSGSSGSSTASAIGARIG